MLLEARKVEKAQFARETGGGEQKLHPPSCPASWWSHLIVEAFTIIVTLDHSRVL